jgi:hypothetical protein
MCSRAEWERLVHRAEEAVDEGQLREFVSDAAARIDALIGEIRGWACVPHDAEWVRGHGRRSPPRWV